MVCEDCGNIVGCESCHVQLKRKEIRDNADGDDLATNNVVKEANDWRCPICKHLFYGWSGRNGFITIKGCDFLSILKEIQSSDE